MRQKVISVVMGGGRGTRLFPLTSERCKPAVPLAGKYRLVDIPISNCLNSGFNQIYVLTQFNTASLHRHIQETYRFDPFGGGFVDILSAEQTARGDSWYQGTADSVRQNLHHLHVQNEDLVLILAGDQLYQMDFSTLVRQHQKSGAEITVSAIALRTDQVAGLGLMRVDDDRRIQEFVEKPSDPAIIEGLAVGQNLAKDIGAAEGEKYVLASMGIYLFNADVLRRSLDNDYTDFGREVIPHLLTTNKLEAFVFKGYWEDIGTVGSFFEANLALTDLVPPFNFFDATRRIYTHARYLPASKVNSCRFERAILADGCIVTDSELTRSVIGVRSIVKAGCRFNNVVMMGADYFESPDAIAEARSVGKPAIGVGENCHIENAIIDKNARIGDNVRLSPRNKPDRFSEDAIYVRDGVLIVQKNGVVPSGTDMFE